MDKNEYLLFYYNKFKSEIDSKVQGSLEEKNDDLTSDIKEIIYDNTDLKNAQQFKRRLKLLNEVCNKLNESKESIENYGEKMLIIKHLIIETEDLLEFDNHWKSSSYQSRCYSSYKKEFFDYNVNGYPNSIKDYKKIEKLIQDEINHLHKTKSEPHLSLTIDVIEKIKVVVDCKKFIALIHQ